MKDLIPRVAVSVVGVPAVLFLLHQGGWVLGIPFAVVAALGAGEVSRFAECRGVRPLSWVGMPAAAALVLAATARPDYAAFAPWALGILGVVILASLTLALWLRGPGGHPLGAVAVTLFGALYGGLPPAVVVLLHALPERLGWGPLHGSPWTGLAVMALPLACTWVGDAAAYFAGTAWGKKKLFPSVSPGKSWVGAWAGVAGAATAAAAWFAVVSPHLPGLPIPSAGWAAGVGVILGVGAIVGDLAESLLKREAGLKDSGRLFPGHGGILDRLDSLVFTVPMAYALLWILEAGL